MVTELKIGITGLPSVGKTRTLLKIVEKLQEKDAIVGGMLTESIASGPTPLRSQHGTCLTTDNPHPAPVPHPSTPPRPKPPRYQKRVCRAWAH